MVELLSIMSDVMEHFFFDCGTAAFTLTLHCKTYRSIKPSAFDSVPYKTLLSLHRARNRPGTERFTSDPVWFAARHCFHLPLHFY